MKDNDKMVLSDQIADKEYEIPELVDLNGIGEALGIGDCTSGSGNAGLCVSGAAGPS